MNLNIVILKTNFQCQKQIKKWLDSRRKNFFHFYDVAYISAFSAFVRRDLWCRQYCLWSYLTCTFNFQYSECIVRDVNLLNLILIQIVASQACIQLGN